MIIREVLPAEKDQFNAQAVHPLQSWEWGEFRQKTGVKVIRLGAFEKQKLLATYQMTAHSLPLVGKNIIYFPRGPLPDKALLEALTKVGLENNTIFVKMEPNILSNPDIKKFLLGNSCQEGRPQFTKYTFTLDLTKPEEQLLAEMKSKTRYNIRLAQKHGVVIAEDNSPAAFEKYLKLTTETTTRQGFYSHTPNYHRRMWETLQPAGIAHLFTATYQGQILATYLFFVFNQVLYYPYGASTREHREVMPTYALFWEAIKFGKRLGCQKFDMWGASGPNPAPNDPWLGFHRFKEGFGATLTEFIGTYDLILNQPFYSLYNLANDWRWKFLRLTAKFKH